MIQIHAPEFAVAGEHWTLSAVIETAAGRRQRLWYRGPGSTAASVSRLADPFVIAAVFPAMRAGRPLRVAGPVTPSLLGNLEEFIAAWSGFRPASYRRVAIQADHVEEPPAPRTTGALLAFSGGVDSCYTAWRHTQGLAGYQRLPLAAGLLVHGFDLPLDQPESFERAAEHARTLLGSVGLEFRSVATNLRELGGDWVDVHGAAIASCLHLLRPEFAAGVIGGTHAYEDRILDNGTSPLTDRMLSGRQFPIIHDAAATPRPAKIRALGDWPEARQHVRVCWQGPHQGRNCGRCNKCVNTILQFRIAGHGALAAFAPEPTPAEIARVRHRNATMLAASRQTIALARQSGAHDPGIAALRRALWRSRLSPSLWRERLRAGRDRLRLCWLPVVKPLWRRLGLPTPRPHDPPLSSTR